MNDGHLDDILRSAPLFLSVIISSTSCDAHHPALDLVSSWSDSNTEPQTVVPDASV
jgi:hypothetical protein